MPGPLSHTSSRAVPSSASTVTTIREPAGVWRSALSSRARSTWRARVSSPSAWTLPSPSTVRTSDPRRAATPRTSRAQSSAIAASSTSSRATATAAGVEAREVEQVGRQLGEPIDLLAHRREEPVARRGVGVVLRCELEEAAERRERRAQLVRRVRDERPARILETTELDAHRVERAGEVGDLVAAPRRRPDRRTSPPRAVRPRAAAAAAGASARTSRRPRAGRAAAIAIAPPVRIRRSTSETELDRSSTGVANTTTYVTPKSGRGYATSAARRPLTFPKPVTTRFSDAASRATSGGGPRTRRRTSRPRVSGSSRSPARRIRGRRPCRRRARRRSARSRSARPFA